MLTQFSSKASDTSCVPFAIWVRLIPLGLSKMLLSTLVSFVAKKAGAQRFIVDERASNRHFLRPPSGPLLKGEELCDVEFQGAPEDAQNWFVGSSDADSWVVAGVFRTRSWDRIRLAPDSLIFQCPYATSVSSWAMFFCPAVTDHCSLAGSADSPVFVCRDHSTPPLLGSKHGTRSVGFRWSYAGKFLSLGSRRKLYQRSSRTSLCRCSESRSRCSRYFFCQRKGRCSRLRSISSQRVLQWNGQTHVTYSRSRSNGLFSSWHWWSGNGARQWSRVLFWRSAALVQPTAEESSSCGSAHLHFACNVHALVRVAEMENGRYRPIACATSPMLVGRDRSVRNKSFYLDKSPGWVGPN